MPGPEDQVSYTRAVQIKEVLQLPFPLSVSFTWDAFVRAAYERANTAVQRQANLLLMRGAVTVEEAKQLVEVQRNTLVQQFRRPLTPFGRLYSEILKPSNNLPTLKKLLEKKGSVEAVLRSVGGTRQAVNRLMLISRAVGPGAITIGIVMSVVVIELAPANQKQLVASRQAGGAVGAVAVGGGGAWIGCASLAALASPSLVIPVVGEVGTGTACLIGGVMGGIGFGALGRWGGEKSGEAVYWKLLDWNWIEAPAAK